MAEPHILEIASSSINKHASNRLHVNMMYVLFSASYAKLVTVVEANMMTQENYYSRQRLPVEWTHESASFRGR